MLRSAGIEQRRRKNLYTLLMFAAMVDDMSNEMSTGHYQWQRTILGHNFSVTRADCQPSAGSGFSVVNGIRTWLGGHEETQVMLASVLVMVGLWWLVRTVLSLFIHLFCPILVVLLAIICVPQLRAPLLGQNYPALVNVIRSILIKLAENIKQTN